MVETELAAVRVDVAEVKSDVKVLVTTVSSLATALAVSNAVEAQHAKSRASTGVWVRWALPILLTVANVILVVYTLVKG